MKIPISLENDPSAAAAFRIYSAAWRSKLGTPETHSTVSDAARSLLQTTTSSNDAESLIYGAVYALPAFFTLSPSAVDFGLNIFAKFADSLPDEISHNYGKGSQGAKNILKWFLVEQSTFFQGQRGQYGKETADDPSASDSSNIIFQPSEIEGSRMAVQAQLEEFRKARTEIIILMTMLGRCHAMDIVRTQREVYAGDQIVGFIDLALQHQYQGTPRWGKVDFIACCVMLRSCAKSLIASLPEKKRDATVARWKEEFAKFLYSTDGKNVDEDFAVKMHAARVLTNLDEPADEESTVLFESADWIF